MEPKIDDLPSEAVQQDSVEDKAPDPRKHYDSPEGLAEDVELDLATREALLLEWKYDLTQQLEAESEGMSAPEASGAAQNARLAAESRRVSQAHEAVSSELERANTAAQGN
jgi:hypothetical protein